jgi:hypothetical protein
MAINTLYSDFGVLKSARKAYKKQNPNNIRLENYFQIPVFNLLRNKIIAAKYTLKFDPEKYKYHIASVPEINSFLGGKYFHIILSTILGVENLNFAFEIRKFCCSNYTLLNDSYNERPGIDFVIDFSKKWDGFGGHTTYLTKTKEILHLNPVPNSLSFVERNKKSMRYIKYVQHMQKEPLYFVVGTLFKQKYYY